MDWTCMAVCNRRSEENCKECSAAINVPQKINPDYDQSVKFDGDKLRYELVPVEVEEELAKVLTYGANKYSANSWQKVEPFEDRYYAAARRHLAAWRKGESIDPESGLHHLSHALCCVAFLLSRELENR